MVDSNFVRGGSVVGRGHPVPAFLLDRQCLERRATASLCEPSFDDFGRAGRSGLNGDSSFALDPNSRAMESESSVVAGRRFDFGGRLFDFVDFVFGGHADVDKVLGGFGDRSVGGAFGRMAFPRSTADVADPGLTLDSWPPGGSIIFCHRSFSEGAG